jgi:toxin ParE1/3/4
MAKVVLLGSAKADLKGIWLYTYREWGEAQADQYLAAIDGAIQRIGEHPEIGSPRDYIREGYRALLCGRHVIYYTTQGQMTRVVRVLHERMDVSDKM